MKDVHCEMLDQSAERVADTCGLDRIRIREILAKRLETAAGQLPDEHLAADLDMAGSILLTELSDARQHVGPDRALEICECVDLGRLVTRRIYVQDWSRLDPLLYSASELTARLAELKKHLIRNREDLLGTGYPVIATVEAYHLLSSPWWYRFGMLYPTKIPVGQSGSIDSSKASRSTFAWGRRPGKRFTSQEEARARRTAVSMTAASAEDTCDYGAAPPIEGLSSQDAARLESLREKVLDLELQILGALGRALMDGNGAGVWNACAASLTGLGASRDQRLSGHDIDFLIGVDRFYGGDLDSARSSSEAIVATLPGAFSMIILLICLAEWTVTSGLTQRIRDVLGPAGLIEEKPLRPPRLAIRSPYEIAGTPAEEAFDKAIALHLASAKDADAFFRDFFQQVHQLLEREVPVPVGVEMWVPRGAEKDARGVLQVFASAQETHVEQFGQPMPLSLGGGAGPRTDGPSGEELYAPGRAGAGGERCIFRRAPHGTWTFDFSGKSITTDKNRKGLSTIAYLLWNADTDCTVMDLAAISAGGAPPAGIRPRGMDEAVLSAEGLSIGWFGDSGDLLDPRARSEYRERRQIILRDLDEAERRGDLAQIPKLKREKAAVEAEIARAFGLGHRRRKAGGPLERARKTVGKQIYVGLAFIKERHPELYVHLRTRLDYDHYVWVYRSVPGITWDT